MSKTKYTVERATLVSMLQKLSPTIGAESSTNPMTRYVWFTQDRKAFTFDGSGSMQGDLAFAQDGDGVGCFVGGLPARAVLAWCKGLAGDVVSLTVTEGSDGVRLQCGRPNYRPVMKPIENAPWSWEGFDIDKVKWYDGSVLEAMKICEPFVSQASKFLPGTVITESGDAYGTDDTVARHAVVEGWEGKTRQFSYSFSRACSKAEHVGHIGASVNVASFGEGVLLQSRTVRVDKTNVEKVIGGFRHKPRHSFEGIEGLHEAIQEVSSLHGLVQNSDRTIVFEFKGSKLTLTSKTAIGEASTSVDLPKPAAETIRVEVKSEWFSNLPSDPPLAVDVRYQGKQPCTVTFTYAKVHHMTATLAVATSEQHQAAVDSQEGAAA